MSLCRMSNCGQKSGRVLGLELGTWSCHLLHGTDEGWMTFMRHRLPKKVKDVIHHKLQIKIMLSSVLILLSTPRKPCSFAECQILSRKVVVGRITALVMLFFSMAAMKGG